MSVFLTLIAMFWLIYSPQLHAAGQTQFKCCVWCDQLTYQFNPKCDNCGASQFRDIYLKPDAEKRDRKNAKELKKPIPVPHCPPKPEKAEKQKAFKVSSYEENMKNQMYEMYISPIEILIYRLGYNRIEDDVDDLIVELIEIREELIELYKLDDYRRGDYHYRDSYKDVTGGT